MSYTTMMCPKCKGIIKLNGHIFVEYKELQYGTSEWVIQNLYKCVDCGANITT